MINRVVLPSPSVGLHRVVLWNGARQGRTTSSPGLAFAMDRGAHSDPGPKVGRDWWTLLLCATLLYLFSGSVNPADLIKRLQVDQQKEVVSGSPGLEPLLPTKKDGIHGKTHLAHARRSPSARRCIVIEVRIVWSSHPPG